MAAAAGEMENAITIPNVNILSLSLHTRSQPNPLSAITIALRCEIILTINKTKIL